MLTVLTFQDNELEAKQLAIDKPSKKMLQFMQKHYSLKKLVDQGNNFVIFEEFFDTPGNMLYTQYTIIAINTHKSHIFNCFIYYNFRIYTTKR